MRPAIPGRRIKRRVWLWWGRDKQQLKHSDFADDLPEIYDWVIDVLEQRAARELETVRPTVEARPHSPDAR